MMDPVLGMNRAVEGGEILQEPIHRRERDRVAALPRAPCDEVPLWGRHRARG